MDSELCDPLQRVSDESYARSRFSDCVVTGSCALNCSGCVVAVSPDTTNPKNVTVPSPLVNFPNMEELGMLLRVFPTLELQDCHGGTENVTVGKLCVPYV